MLDHQQIADAAKAHGFDVLHVDEDVVTLGIGLQSQIWLSASEDDTVFAMLAEATWSYEGGSDWREFEMGTLPLSEMLSYLTWLGKVEADQQERFATQWAEPDPDCTSVGFSGEGRCIEPAGEGGLCVEHARRVRDRVRFL